jgi:hypothetical protein
MILKHHVTPNLILVATIAGVYAAVQTRVAVLLEFYAFVYDCMSRLMIIESSNAATDGDRQLQTVLEYAKKMEPASKSSCCGCAHCADTNCASLNGHYGATDKCSTCSFAHFYP